MLTCHPSNFDLIDVWARHIGGRSLLALIALLVNGCLSADADDGQDPRGNGPASSDPAQFEPSGPDDDRDGFHNDIDPAPNDAENPGDFFTPEAILASPIVQAALEEIDAAGDEFHPEVGSPPDISGYYLGKTDPASALGVEVRIDQFANAEISIARQYFEGDRPTVHAFVERALLRGTPDRYTFYSRVHSVCAYPDADYEIFTVDISTGDVDASTGDRTNVKTARITVASRGDLDEDCKSLLGSLAPVGGWILATPPPLVKISATDLKHMCVSEQQGYIPEETWMTSAGATCTCGLDLSVSCNP